MSEEINQTAEKNTDLSKNKILHIKNLREIFPQKYLSKIGLKLCDSGQLMLKRQTEITRRSGILHQNIQAEKPIKSTQL